MTCRPPRKWALPLGIALALTALGACSSARTPAAQPSPPHARVIVRPLLPAAPGTEWQPLECSIDADLRGPTLPLDELQVAHPDGADPRFNGLSREARDELLANGFLVRPNERGPKRMGAFYTDLATARVPYVLTLDALFELAHLAIAAALAEVETRATVVVLKTLLERMETRLKLEQVGAPSDLLAPYALARGYVAVTQSLLSPGYAPPIELGEVVARETGKILARGSDGVSPLLGVRLDYAALAPRAGAGLSDGGRVFRALAWVAQAPLLLTGSRTPGAAPVDVSRLRTHTRAALLLARLVDPAIEPEGAREWERVEALARFLVGPADDPSPRDLARLALTMKLDLRDTKGLVNVVRIDRLRRAATEDGAKAPRLFDGSPPSVRLFGARWTPDAETMNGLVSSRMADRRPPSATDVLSALGASPKREWHASLYLSELDAIATMVTPSLAAGAQPSASSSAWQQRTLERALSAWTTLRHDFSSAGRAPVSTVPSVKSFELGGPALVFVEPHPEAIGKLVSLVRQALGGLSAMGALDAASPAKAVLSDVDQLLGVAFEVALLSANDEPPSADQAATLATFPRWLSVLEDALSSETARVVDVHTDLENRRVLEEGTGSPDELYFVMREAQTGRMVLTVGATLPHFEFMQNASDRLADDPWRARLEAGNVPAR